MYKPCDALSRMLILLCRLHAQLIEPAQRIGIPALIEFPLRIEHARRPLFCRRVVEVSDIAFRKQRKIFFIICHMHCSFR